MARKKKKFSLLSLLLLIAVIIIAIAVFIGGIAVSRWFIWGTTEVIYYGEVARTDQQIYEPTSITQDVLRTISVKEIEGSNEVVVTFETFQGFPLGQTIRVEVVLSDGRTIVGHNYVTPDGLGKGSIGFQNESSNTVLEARVFTPCGIKGRWKDAQ